MAESLKERMSEMQARVDEQYRLLQATTGELEKESASRRGEIVDAGEEPGNPAIATSDRVPDSLLNY